MNAHQNPLRPVVLSSTAIASLSLACSQPNDAAPAGSPLSDQQRAPLAVLQILGIAHGIFACATANECSPRLP
jgi:hypothetical protein